jgi:hypothetical protein
MSKKNYSNQISDLDETLKDHKRKDKIKILPYNKIQHEKN